MPPQQDARNNLIETLQQQGHSPKLARKVADRINATKARDVGVPPQKSGRLPPDDDERFLEILQWLRTLGRARLTWGMLAARGATIEDAKRLVRERFVDSSYPLQRVLAGGFPDEAMVRLSASGLAYCEKRGITEDLSDNSHIVTRAVQQGVITEPIRDEAESRIVPTFEAVKMFSVSRSTLRRYVADGKLKDHRQPGHAINSTFKLSVAELSKHFSRKDGQ